MRLSHVVHAAVVMSVVGTCVAWGADAPRATPVMSEPRTVVAPRIALSQTVHELSAEALSLSKVIDFLRDMSGTNIVVNWKVLEAAGVVRDTPVTLQVRELTLRKMLQLVLDQASPATQLTFSTDSNVLEITTQDEADKKLVTKIYIVDDLVMSENKISSLPTFNLEDSTKNGSTGGTGGGDRGSGNSLFQGANNTNAASADDSTQKRGDDLVALIKEVVRPTIWKDNGGPASIKYYNGKLVVLAPVSVHEAIGGPVSSEAQRYGM